MEFNPNNNIIKLCIQAMGMEEKGNAEDAGKLFRKPGTKRQMTLKNILLLIMWPGIKKIFPTN